MVVTVIGAGFAGLTLADELARRGRSVRLIEASDRLGGLLRTLQTPFGPVETGAPSFSRTDRVDRFVADLGLEAMEPSSESSRRYFYSSRLTRWPLGWGSTVSMAARYFGHKIRGTVRPKGIETVHEWACRVLGQPAADRLVSTAFRGIYASLSSELDASLVVGPIFDPAREKFKGILAVKGGMGRLVSALETRLRENGGEIVLGESLSRLPEGKVVVCTPPRVTADLVRDRLPELSLALEKIPMVPVVATTVFFEDINPLQGFGCLVDPQAGLRTMGVLLNHHIFPERPGTPSETWIMGGVGSEALLSCSDQEIRNIVLSERQKIFGLSQREVHATVVRWPRALPVYGKDLREALGIVPKNGELRFHGNWTGGIGLSRILRGTQEIANEICEENR